LSVSPKLHGHFVCFFKNPRDNIEPWFPVYGNFRIKVGRFSLAANHNKIEQFFDGSDKTIKDNEQYREQQ